MSDLRWSTAQWLRGSAPAPHLLLLTKPGGSTLPETMPCLIKRPFPLLTNTSFLPTLFIRSSDVHPERNQLFGYYIRIRHIASVRSRIFLPRYCILPKRRKGPNIETTGRATREARKSPVTLYLEATDADQDGKSSVGQSRVASRHRSTAVQRGEIR